MNISIDEKKQTEVINKALQKYELQLEQHDIIINNAKENLKHKETKKNVAKGFSIGLVGLIAASVAPIIILSPLFSILTAACVAGLMVSGLVLNKAVDEIGEANEIIRHENYERENIESSIEKTKTLQNNLGLKENKVNAEAKVKTSKSTLTNSSNNEDVNSL